MKEFSSFKLKSHPNKLLIEHLKGVGELSLKKIKSKKIELKTIDSDILKDISYLIGVTHDIGKSTKNFQEYIMEEDNEKKAKLKNKKETHHGLLSSIFTYLVVESYLKNKGLGDEKIYKYLPILSFLAVKRHHGNLDNITDEILVLVNENDLEIIGKQLENIDFNEVNKIFTKLLVNYKIDTHFSNFKDNYYEKIKKEIFKKNKKLLRKLLIKLDKKDDILYYFIFQLLYSILLESDKSDAIFGFGKSNKIDSRSCLDENLVDKYRKIKGFNNSETWINKIRNDIYYEVILNLNKPLSENRIFSLNVPTGTGKTLTSFSFALKLRKKIEEEYGFKPRIIYSLPFLSIIDQNYEVFEDVFKKVLRKIPQTDILLKHHHLSEIFYSSKEEEFEIDESLFLIEGWNSEIIVTTFIQFFHTLISNKNRSIRKFHNIVNSIIILDEVQSIPHKYWLLLRKVIETLAKEYHTYFIFVTATLPLIFDENNDKIVSLIEKKEKYFNQFNRIKLLPKIENSINLEEFKEIIGTDLIEKSNKDFMIVLNTINSSTSILEFIESLSLEGTETFYLSTNIIPKERLKRIREIRNKENKKRKVIVTTQLVEAGVDIDVDIIYRDFAPLDSINQVAGRCNRNFLKKSGEVRIFMLKDERKEYYKYIYEGFLIDKTKEIIDNALLQSTQIPEDEFLKLANRYFSKVKEGLSKDESKKILSIIKKMEFNETKKFKLIEENYEKVDIFIELDDNAKKVRIKYCEIREINDTFKRKNEFLKIKKEFYDYIISVPKKFAEGFIDENIGYVLNEELDIYYHSQTGFKRNNAGKGTLIC